MSSRKERTRTRILEAARRLLAERGYHGVGLEEVAREAGVSRQALYLHFGSKAELLVALARYVDEVEGVPELLRQVPERETALEGLDEAIAAYAAIEPRIYRMALTMYDARRSDPAAEAAWQDRMAFRRANARRDMQRLEAEGRLADGWTVDEATDLAWALASVHTFEYLVIERGWPIERLVRRLREVLHRAVVKSEVG